MKQYLDLARHVIDNGVWKENRTGVRAKSTFGYQMRFDMADGFPIVTTKSVHFPSVVHELLWFISGDTNIRYLQDNGVRIWNEWADENGDLGPVYGRQWRSWLDHKVVKYADVSVGLEERPESVGYVHVADMESLDAGLYVRKIDQLQRAINVLRNNPDDRRIIVAAWNPSVLPEDGMSFAENVANGRQALPPCHAWYQFYHREGKLSLQIYQRSCDVFLGVPFNISSYALLLHLVSQVTNLQPDELIWTGGDVHIYENHIEQIETQLTRQPYELPTLVLNQDRKEIDDFVYDDIRLENYKHHPKLVGKVAV